LSRPLFEKAFGSEDYYKDFTRMGEAGLKTFHRPIINWASPIEASSRDLLQNIYGTTMLATSFRIIL
jgi:hypothetical protein